MGGLILIADDLVTDRIALKARLAAAQHEVIQVRRPDELAQRTRADRPDAVLMDIDFPGGGINACRALKSLSGLRDLPVVLYGAGHDRATRLAAFEAGADDCLNGLPDETLLLALLRNLMRKQAERQEIARRQEIIGTDAMAEMPRAFAPRPRVTLVPPSSAEGAIWRRALAADTRAVVECAAPDHALDRAATADAYVIAPPEGDDGQAALRLICELRARPATRHAALILATPGPLTKPADMALDLGADAVIPGPFEPRELALRLDRLIAAKHLADRARAQMDAQLDVALRDPLTGLFNRRYAERYLARMDREVAAGGGAYALMVLDLDHFKAVNDSYGHAVGDAVLKRSADRLQGAIRETDLAARMGGEEFLVVLREADMDRARRSAERLRTVIAAQGGPGTGQSGQNQVPVTVSIGVALGMGDHRRVLEQADRALYASKASGRNCVTFAPTHNAA